MRDAVTVTIGHSRDEPARAAAKAFADRWTGSGRIVLDVVDWPEEAASWLRQANRFTAGNPDAWVVVATERGWAGMRQRLSLTPAWDPSRTYELMAVRSPRRRVSADRYSSRTESGSPSWLSTESDARSAGCGSHGSA